MGKNIIIHVGYPKSASTTLQKHLFNKHKDINYLGAYPTGNVGVDSKEIDRKNEYLNNESLRNFYSNIIKLDSIEYSQSKNKELFHKSIKPLLKSKKINLFSHEAITDTFSADRGEKARRLKELFPEAKIIFIIREQSDLLRSQYNDHPFDPACRSSGKPVSIDKWLKKSFENKDHIKLIRALDYYETINFYASLFGKDNIGIFLFEELRDEPEKFAQKISDFMGVDSSTSEELIKDKHENKAVSKAYNRMRILERVIGVRFFSYLNRKFKMRYIKQLGSNKVAIPNEWKNKINQYYLESNKKLKKEFNIKSRSFANYLKGHNYE